MKKKWVLPSGIRVFFCMLQHITAVLIAVFLVVAIIATVVPINSDDGVEYCFIHPFVDPAEFEESYIFNKMLERDVNSALTYIRLQMDTSIVSRVGAMNFEVPVNVMEYANGDLGGIYSDLSVEYSSKDLQRWYDEGTTYHNAKFTSKEAFVHYFSENETLTFEEIIALFDLYNISYYEINFTSYYEIYIEMLNDMYLSSGKKTIEDVANSWEDYILLVTSLQDSIKRIGIEVKEYVQLRDYFKEMKNISFGYEVEVNPYNGIGISISSSEFSQNSLEECYSSGGRYIYYDSTTGIMNHNTNVHGSVIYNQIENFNVGGFGHVKFWLRIDTTYPEDDYYAQANWAYDGRTKSLEAFAGAAIAAVIWLILMIFNSFMTGRRKDEEGNFYIHLNLWDRMITEVALVMSVGIGVAYIMGSYLVAIEIPYRSWIMYSGDQWLLYTTIIGLATLGSILFSSILNSFIRRIKGHNLIKNSFCYYICAMIRKLYKDIKKMTVSVYRHSPIMGRNILLYVAFVVMNIIFGYGIVYSLVYSYMSEYMFTAFILTLLLLGADGFIGYLILMNILARKKILEGVKKISTGDTNSKVNTEGMRGENKEMAEAVNSIGEGIKVAVETSMRDERLKAELITNVSHDIKTPLTSIINYVDLLKRENIEEEPIKGYIEVLESKSQRLKQLTDDLVEASKVSSGNVVLNMEKIDLSELLKQAVGEFSEKFDTKKLQVIENFEQPPHIIYADSRHTFRVIENLFNNIYKYAMEGTRVYIEIKKVETEDMQIMLSVKNISALPLNIKPEELTERFIRGEESRTTEGSGLGLSIAKSLTEIQNGKFKIELDGDLFKVVILFREDN